MKSVVAALLLALNVFGEITSRPSDKQLSAIHTCANYMVSAVHFFVVEG
jgi:hypothetical protein